MSSGHHSTTRLAISVVSLQKAQCQAYLTSSFFFLSRFVERHRNSIPLCVSCSSGGNVKSKSNEVSGSQIVDWCTNAIRSSFLEFHVGRTKGRDNVYYLYWNIEMLIIGIVRTETATYVWTPQDWFRLLTAKALIEMLNPFGGNKPVVVPTTILLTNPFGAILKITKVIINNTKIPGGDLMLGTANSNDLNFDIPRCTRVCGCYKLI